MKKNTLAYAMQNLRFSQ